ncbi:MAG: hypothetical protein WBM08_03510 [Prochlorococcaceae cyanobacterium]
MFNEMEGLLSEYASLIIFRNWLKGILLEMAKPDSNENTMTKRQSPGEWGLSRELPPNYEDQ